MTHRSFLFKIGLIAFFFGVNIILGKYFLEESQINPPKYLVEIFDIVGSDYFEIKNTSSRSNTISEQFDEQAVSVGILTEINDFRIANNRSLLTRTPALDSVANNLLKAEIQAQMEGKEVEKNLLSDLLKEEKYNYEAISHNSVEGPLTVSGNIQAILGHDEQSELLLKESYTDIGIAIIEKSGDSGEEIGYLVYLLANEFVKPALQAQETSTKTPQTIVQKKQTSFPFISNTEVLLALNSYRASHNVPSLVEEEHLCEYAEKRVLDQVAYGSLDGHEGFKKDFDGNNVPSQLAGYQGTTIGENLAYQHCRNMQTDESFIAESAAALIEWCFDSSTKGHREAQLNSKYNNVCVRNQDGYFVVIFGE